MKAIIAEKPSVAREIAQLLRAHEKKDGCEGFQKSFVADF